MKPLTSLEDALNDLAVIRCGYERSQALPGDAELESQVKALVGSARANLARRLGAVQRELIKKPAHSLGLDLAGFKDQLLQLAVSGHPRSRLDRMMCGDVFESVSDRDPTFRYEFLPQHPLHELQELPPSAFIARLFDDLLETVVNDCNYADALTFDRCVFQKFVAVMFCSYVATDPRRRDGDSHP